VCLIIYNLCTGEVVDNELFAEPVTPAPAAQQDATGQFYHLNIFYIKELFVVQIFAVNQLLTC